MILTLLLLACGTDEPVVRAVPPAKTVEEVRQAREDAEIRASPYAIDMGYHKPEGVYVDVRYLGGRTYTIVRDAVTTQLGALASESTLPSEQGTELTFERGTLRVKDGRIVLVDVPLPEPMRRSEALRVTGFPDQVPRSWVLLSGEFRLTNSFDFRRIVFVRAAPESEDVVRVQAWKSGLTDR